MKALLTITLPDYAALLAKVAAQARRKEEHRDRRAGNRPEPVEKEDGQ